MAARTHHGTASSALAELRALEQIPDRMSIDLRRRSSSTCGRRVLFGNPLGEICVGGWDAVLTQSHYPPARGDAWEVDVPLQRGAYAVKICGWSNPSHGVLDLWLDDVCISPLGLDWCGERTAKQTCRASGIRIPSTGAHKLLARVDRSNANPLRENGFWMCLRRISFTRESGIGETAESSGA